MKSKKVFLNANMFYRKKKYLENLTSTMKSKIKYDQNTK